VRSMLARSARASSAVAAPKLQRDARTSRKSSVQLDFAAVAERHGVTPGGTQSRVMASMHTTMARILASSWPGVISTP
jgi:hypothetical protein